MLLNYGMNIDMTLFFSGMGINLTAASVVIMYVASFRQVYFSADSQSQGLIRTLTLTMTDKHKIVPTVLARSGTSMW